MSVYPAHFDVDKGTWVPDIGHEDDALWDFFQQFSHRPCYLVKGAIVGRGTDGEPLMYPVEKRVRVIKPSLLQWRGRVLNKGEIESTILEQIKSEDPVFEGMIKAVLPHSTELARSSVLHGPTPHWRAVAKWGRKLTKHMREGNIGNLENAAYTLESGTFEPQEVDLTVVRWFACLHDSQRLTDGKDPEHGQRAAEKARELREAGVIALDDEQFDQLYDALYYHAGKYVSREDVTIGTCFDADIMCLGRVNVKPRPKKTSTPAARGILLRYQATARG